MELTLIETKFYHHQGLYYAVKGSKLIQFDKDHWLDINPGSELHGSISRRLRKTTPIGNSEAVKALEILKSSISEMCE